MRFRATAEGRGTPTHRLGSERTGARGMAGTWNVRAEAGVFYDSPAMGGFGSCLALRLQALTDSGGKLNGGVTPLGSHFELWAGTEEAALELAGARGLALQARALHQAAQALEDKARDCEARARRET